MDEEQWGTPFRDMVMLALLGFVAIVIMVIFHIRPPTKDEQATPPGNVIIQLYWPDEQHADVDVWTQHEKDPKPVGYSNKSGIVMNLLRDDRGVVNGDLSGKNYENAYSRGLIAGEYIVNLHLYANASGKPVPVRVIISISKEEGGKSSIKDVHAETVTLVKTGEEATVVRFTLTDQGNVIGIHHIPVSLLGRK